MNKNATIREHLASTSEIRRSKNCFRYGAVEIKIGHDSPIDGFEFDETIKVSIYDPQSDVDVIIVAKIKDVVIVDNALECPRV